MRQVNLKNNINLHDIITSNNYLDIYHRVTANLEEDAKEAGAAYIQQILQDWAVFHIEVPPEECEDFYLSGEYFVIPNVYGLTSISSMEIAGIGPVLKSDTLDLSGRDVIVAVIDTGIDYTHEAFIYEDNTSKIMSIWDQTIEGTPPDGFFYGAEYSNEQINKAINSEDPLSIVPSVDEVGHGTFLAGIAAGRPNRREQFQGAAPDANLVIVKLKQAKKCIKDFFKIKEGAIAFQTNDIYQGVKYVLDKYREFNQPIAILFAGASNDGPHNGTNELEEFLAAQGDSVGVVIVTSAGNEANAAHHYHGKFKEGVGQINVDLHVAEDENGVFLNMWVPLPDQLSVELISPSGVSTGVIPPKLRQWQNNIFPLEASVIRTHYDLVEERAAEESIAIIIENPLPGLWTLIVHGEIVINGEFDIYLPIRPFIEEDTIFLSPDPNTTVVIPSTNPQTITVGAYNEIINSIYLPSGRGYTRDNRIKPDLVAPGVDVLGPYPNNQYISMSGTSVASAIAAGASALLLEWGIIKENDTTMNTTSTKTYLARGAKRRAGIRYPNREWGYGELDLFNVFRII
ncbi:S8 family peptidase [Vallitalea okinawensis]|uniref:S8 family peptidase n=1 Tax=Vallitalea okinawensis TaxID=2078660 RepID=UPI000CFDC5B3|nr:S8 family peptidase [Vallitalea okinawensis]